MNEQWRGVPGYEGYYEVSDQGRVKSLDRKINVKTGKRALKEKILRPSELSNGYYIVGLSRNGRSTTKYVHKLVAEAFLDHVPCKYKEIVDHINHDKKDNRVDNLRVVSPRENASNTSKKYTSQYVGVSKKGTRWASAISFDGVKYNLGNYDKEEQAAYAYQEALSLYNYGFPGDAVVNYLKSSGQLQGCSHFNKYNTTSWDGEKWVSYITVGDEVVHLGEYEEENTARGVSAYFQLGRLASGSRTEEELITFMRSDTYADILKQVNKLEWHTSM